MFHKDKLLRHDPSPHSPHNIIPLLIKSNAVVLDVGCNAGFLGRTLNERGIITDGIDINEKALNIAKKYNRKVYKRDLYRPQLKLNNSKYDYIVFSDILEHLPRPDLVLIDTKKYLKNDGRIIASIPNIARIEYRLELLFGKFDYKPGLISEDHLRFFTKKSAAKMFKDCGYIVERCLPTGFGSKIKILLTLTAFQFIYVAKLK